MKVVVVLLVALWVGGEAKKKDGPQEDFEFVEVRRQMPSLRFFPTEQRSLSELDMEATLTPSPYTLTTSSPPHPPSHPHTLTLSHS